MHSWMPRSRCIGAACISFHSSCPSCSPLLHRPSPHIARTAQGLLALPAYLACKLPRKASRPQPAPPCLRLPPCWHARMLHLPSGPRLTALTSPPSSYLSNACKEPSRAARWQGTQALAAHRSHLHSAQRARLLALPAHSPELTSPFPCKRPVLPARRMQEVGSSPQLQSAPPLPPCACRGYVCIAACSPSSAALLLWPRKESVQTALMSAERPSSFDPMCFGSRPPWAGLRCAGWLPCEWCGGPHYPHLRSFIHSYGFFYYSLAEFVSGISFPSVLVAISDRVYDDDDDQPPTADSAHLSRCTAVDS